MNSEFVLDSDNFFLQMKNNKKKPGHRRWQYESDGSSSTPSPLPPPRAIKPEFDAAAKFLGNNDNMIRNCDHNPEILEWAKIGYEPTYPSFPLDVRTIRGGYEEMASIYNDLLASAVFALMASWKALAHFYAGFIENAFKIASACVLHDEPSPKKEPLLKKQKKRFSCVKANTRVSDAPVGALHKIILDLMTKIQKVERTLDLPLEFRKVFEDLLTQVSSIERFVRLHLYLDA
jgi:hypothetical protein